MVRGEKTLIEITSSRIDAKPLYDFVLTERAGAVDIFVGTVRNVFEERPVTSIEYHAYPEMAERVLAGIVERAFAQWPIERAAVQHHIGHLKLTEASVIIAVSSAHRDEVFHACRFIIEEIKLLAPIWKKEFFADGTVDWKYSGSKFS